MELQVTAEFKAEQRAAKQVQTEQREVRRCMERMLSHVEAKERAIDCEVHLVRLCTHFCHPARWVAGNNAWEAVGTCFILNGRQKCCTS